MAGSPVFRIMDAFCFKCRGKHELRDTKPIFFKNGSPATQGTCTNCGNESVYKMGRTAAHEGLTPPVVVRAPREKKVATTGKAKPGLKPLVIVESPAKAKTVGRYLGKGYTVRASVGHVRDLLKSQLSVDVENNFAPKYRVPNEKKDVVKELKKLAQKAEFA